MIYSGLQDKDRWVKSQSMIAWEQEIGAVHTTHHWEKTLQLTPPPKAQTFGKCSKR